MREIKQGHFWSQDMPQLMFLNQLVSCQAQTLSTLISQICMFSQRTINIWKYFISKETKQAYHDKIKNKIINCQTNLILDEQPFLQGLKILFQAIDINPFQICIKFLQNKKYNFQGQYNCIYYFLNTTSKSKQINKQLEQIGEILIKQLKKAGITNIQHFNKMDVDGYKLQNERASQLGINGLDKNTFLIIRCLSSMSSLGLCRCSQIIQELKYYLNLSDLSNHRHIQSLLTTQFNEAILLRSQLASITLQQLIQQQFQQNIPTHLLTSSLFNIIISKKKQFQFDKGVHYLIQFYKNRDAVYLKYNYCQLNIAQLNCQQKSDKYWETILQKISELLNFLVDEYQPILIFESVGFFRLINSSMRYDMIDKLLQYMRNLYKTIHQDGFSNGFNIIIQCFNLIIDKRYLLLLKTDTINNLFYVFNSLLYDQIQSLQNAKSNNSHPTVTIFITQSLTKIIKLANIYMANSHNLLLPIQLQKFIQTICYYKSEIKLQYQIDIRYIKLKMLSIQYRPKSQKYSLGLIDRYWESILRYNNSLQKTIIIHLMTQYDFNKNQFAYFYDSFKNNQKASILFHQYIIDSLIEIIQFVSTLDQLQRHKYAIHKINSCLLPIITMIYSNYPQIKQLLMEIDRIYCYDQDSNIRSQQLLTYIVKRGYYCSNKYLQFASLQLVHALQKIHIDAERLIDVLSLCETTPLIDFQWQKLLSLGSLVVRLTTIYLQISSFVLNINTINKLILIEYKLMILLQKITIKLIQDQAIQKHQTLQLKKLYYNKSQLFTIYNQLKVIDNEFHVNIWQFAKIKSSNRQNYFKEFKIFIIQLQKSNNPYIIGSILRKIYYIAQIFKENYKPNYIWLFNYYPYSIIRIIIKLFISYDQTNKSALPPIKQPYFDIFMTGQPSKSLQNYNSTINNEIGGVLRQIMKHCLKKITSDVNEVKNKQKLILQEIKIVQLIQIKKNVNMLLQELLKSKNRSSQIQLKLMNFLLSQNYSLNLHYPNLQHSNCQCEVEDKFIKSIDKIIKDIHCQFALNTYEKQNQLEFTLLVSKFYQQNYYSIKNIVLYFKKRLVKVYLDKLMMDTQKKSQLKKIMMMICAHVYRLQQNIGWVICKQLLSVIQQNINQISHQMNNQQKTFIVQLLIRCLPETIAKTKEPQLINYTNHILQIILTILQTITENNNQIIKKIISQLTKYTIDVDFYCAQIFDMLKILDGKEKFNTLKCLLSERQLKASIQLKIKYFFAVNAPDWRKSQLKNKWCVDISHYYHYFKSFSDNTNVEQSKKFKQVQNILLTKLYNKRYNSYMITLSNSSKIDYSLYLKCSFLDYKPSNIVKIVLQDILQLILCETSIISDIIIAVESLQILLQYYPILMHYVIHHPITIEQQTSIFLDHLITISVNRYIKIHHFLLLFLCINSKYMIMGKERMIDYGQYIGWKVVNKLKKMKMSASKSLLIFYLSQINIIADEANIKEGDQLSLRNIIEDQLKGKTCQQDINKHYNQGKLSSFNLLNSINQSILSRRQFLHLIDHNNSKYYTQYTKNINQLDDTMKQFCSQTYIKRQNIKDVKSDIQSNMIKMKDKDKENRQIFFKIQSQINDLAYITIKYNEIMIVDSIMDFKEEFRQLIGFKNIYKDIQVQSINYISKSNKYHMKLYKKLRHKIFMEEYQNQKQEETFFQLFEERLILNNNHSKVEEITNLTSLSIYATQDYNLASLNKQQNQAIELYTKQYSHLHQSMVNDRIDQLSKQKVISESDKQIDESQDNNLTTKNKNEYRQIQNLIEMIEFNDLCSFLSTQYNGIEDVIDIIDSNYQLLKQNDCKANNLDKKHYEVSFLEQNDLPISIFSTIDQEIVISMISHIYQQKNITLQYLLPIFQNIKSRPFLLKILFEIVQDPFKTQYYRNVVKQKQIIHITFQTLKKCANTILLRIYNLFVRFFYKCFYLSQQFLLQSIVIFQNTTKMNTIIPAYELIKHFALYDPFYPQNLIFLSFSLIDKKIELIQNKYIMQTFISCLESLFEQARNISIIQLIKFQKELKLQHNFSNIFKNKMFIEICREKIFKWQLQSHIWFFMGQFFNNEHCKEILMQLTVKSLNYGKFSPGQKFFLNKTNQIVKKFFDSSFLNKYKMIYLQIYEQWPIQYLNKDHFFIQIYQNIKILTTEKKKQILKSHIEKIKNSFGENIENIVIFPRNQCYLQSTLKYFINKSRPFWFSHFQIKFTNSEEILSGYGLGLYKEWFTLTTRAAANENYFLLRKTAKNYYIFNRFSWLNPRHLQYFQLIGKLFALSLINSKVFVSFSMSTLIYKMLLREDITVDDLRDEFEEGQLIKNIQKIRQYTTNEQFCQNFVYQDIKLVNESYQPLKFCKNSSLITEVLYETEDYQINDGQMRKLRVLKICEKIDLIQKGSQINVNLENREQYISLMRQKIFTLFKLNIMNQFNAFQSGFQSILPFQFFNYLNVNQMKKMIEGSKLINYEQLRDLNCYTDFEQKTYILDWFLEIMSKLSIVDSRYFLQHWTGLSQLPANGFRDLKVQISLKASKQKRLYAQTCFNKLYLPLVESKWELQVLVRQAIQSMRLNSSLIEDN